MDITDWLLWFVECLGRSLILQREVVVIYPGYTRLIDRLRCPVLADGEEFVSCGSRGLVDSVSDNM